MSEPRQRLSLTQERCWLLTRFDPGNPAFHLSQALRLSGPLDRSALRRSLAEVIRRHQVLRTRFTAGDGQPRQVIAPALRLRLPLLDLAALRATRRETELRRLAREHARLPFDPEHAPLLRAALLRLGRGEHVLLLTCHGLIADAWSPGMIHRELLVRYQALSRGDAAPLPEPAPGYAEYGHRQRQWLGKPECARQLAYWRKQLAGAPPTLELPADRPRPPVATYCGARRELALSETLRAHCEQETVPLLRENVPLLRENVPLLRENVPLLVLVLATFQALLWRYTQQDDLVVGLVSADPGRSLIGPLANSLVLRTDLGGNPRFRELLARTHAVIRAALKNRELPFEILVEELRPDRDLSREPLVQVRLVFDQSPPLPELPELAAQSLAIDDGTAPCDLTFEVRDDGRTLAAALELSADLFDATTMTRIQGHLQTLLEAAGQAREQRLSELPMLTVGERHQLLRAWNDTSSPEPAGFLALFAAQVAKRPEAVAVDAGDVKLSYRELDRRTDQLARALQGRGVGPERRVAILAGRSPAMVVAILGVLEAGGAWLPLDPEYPRQRLAFMVADADPVAVLTEKRLLATVPETAAEILCLDAARTAGSAPPSIRTRPGNAAYVIYTSGSTGRPKGVVLTHRGLANLAVAQSRLFDLHAADRVMQFASPSFDAAVSEIAMTLACGAALHLAPRDQLLPGTPLGETLRARRITCITLPPSALAVIGEEELPALAKLVVAGESCPVDLARRWAVGRRFWNAYGPTEATVCATAWRYAGGRRLPIGTPIANARVCLLDRRLEIVPLGVPGEIAVAGTGVARGYLGRPRRTAKQFVPDANVGDPSAGGARLYRTGDLGRHRPDGTIEFLGRLDHQVKLRGFRIELGEIEAVLASHPAVREAAVLVHEQARDRRLVACVVRDPDPRRTAISTPETAAAERVGEWREVFDDAGQQGDAADPTFSTAGWISSYTGAPIAEAEMREWLDDAVRRILSLGPQRVLEIGCGTGMVLYRVAPSCRHYQGTDISPASLDFLRRGLAELEAPLPQVRLEERPADRFAGLAADFFDTVVLNSVVQYFPSVDYLRAVVAGAVELVRPGGAIFLGDVRSLPLNEAFHTSVALAKAPPELPREDLVRRIRTAIREENELVVDPAWFQALARQLPRIARVEIHPKWGRADNELTRFRYQVVLYVAPAAVPEEVTWHDWQSEGLTPAGVRELLEREGAELVALGNVPNARLSAAVAVRLLRGDRGPQTAGELRERLAESASDGIEPEDLRALAAELGYEVELGWFRAGADGAYEAVFRRPREGTVRRPLPIPAAAALGEHRHTNEPLAGRLARRLAPELRRWLADRLPAYMVPAAFAFLDAFPLSPSGKVDRAALGRHLPSETELGSRPAAYVAPRSPLEQQLAEIWSELLGAPGRRVGVDDDFFALGGHSLLATRVVSRLREVLAVELPLRTLFEQPTIAGLAREVAARRRQSAPEVPPIVPVTRDGPLPLSFAQQRLWLLDRFHPGLAVYNLATNLRLQGRLDRRALAAALSEIVRRHEALRTTFAEVDDRPVQVIGPATDLPLPVSDLSALPAPQQRAEAARLAREAARRPFDLARGPLLRTTLRRLGAHRHELLLVVHHIAFDGWSLAVFLRELRTLYQAFAAGRTPVRRTELGQRPTTRSQSAFASNCGQRKTPALPPPAVQYADFAVWQRQWLRGRVLADQLAYWRRQLAGLRVLELPADRPRPPIRSFRGATLGVTVPQPLVESLDALGRSRGATLFMTLLAAFQLLLARTSGADDVAVGSVVANRNRAQIEGLIGFFVNTLLLRTHFDGETFAELLDRVREITLEAHAHQDLPFEKLVEALQPERDLSRQPLFQVMFVLQNPPDPVPELPGLMMRPHDVWNDTAKFDLTLSLEEDARGLRGFIEYATDLYDRTTILRFWESFRTLLAAVAAAPERGIGELHAGSPAGVQQLLREGTGGVRPPPATAGERLLAYAVASADGPAPRTPREEIVAGIWGEVLGTSRRLGVDADFFRLGGHSLLATQVASRLSRALGIEISPALLFEKPTVGALAAALEALAAGDATPSEPLGPAPRSGPPPLSFAQERLWFLHRLDPRSTAYNSTIALELRGRLDRHALRRAFAEIVRRHEVLRTTFPMAGERPVQRIAPPADAHPMPLVDLCALAAAERRRQVGQLIASAEQRPYDLVRGPLFRTVLLRPDRDQHVLLVANHHIVFDGWSTAVVIRELAPLYRAFAESRSGPSPLAPLPIQYADFACWQRQWLRGEVLDRQLDWWRSRLESSQPAALLPPDRPAAPTGGAAAQLGCRLPAELSEALRRLSRRQGASLFMTLTAAFQTLLHRHTGAPAVVVGTPIANRNRYEIEGLIGFFVNTQVIRSDFRDNPPFRRLLERVREFVLGAYAHQDLPFAKLVEALQPERTAQAQPLFQALFALQNAPLPPLELPGVTLATLPMEPRLRRAAFDLTLGLMEQGELMAGSLEYDASRFEATTIGTLLDHFRRLLEEIAADPDRRVGDLSFLSAAERGQLLAKRRRQAEPVRDPAAAAVDPQAAEAAAARRLRAEVAGERSRLSATRQALLARRLRGGKTRPRAAIARRPPQEPPALSFAQERLWFLDQLEPGSAAYNMPFPLRLRGPLDRAALAASLSEIERRHEVLRSSFRNVDGRPLMTVAPPASRPLPPASRPLPLVDLTALPARRRQQEARGQVAREAWRPFALARGPLVRSFLLHLGEQEHLLSFNAHHIVFDGWSVGILVRELGRLYPAFAAGRAAPLSEPPIQYADFARWQRQRLRGEALERQLEYWRRQLAGAPQTLELPADHPRPAAPSFRGGQLERLLGGQPASRLAALAQAEEATLFMVLLAAYAVVLGRTTGQSDLLVGTPVAGRTRAEVEGLVGFFINTLVLRTDVDGNPGFRELLARVKNAALGAFAHQDLPFEKLVGELAPDRDLSRTPFFQVFFNLVNLEDESLELPGLTVERVPALGVAPSKFDLTLYVAESAQGLGIELLYRAELFRPERMAALADAYVGLLEQIAADPDRPIGDYSLRTAAALPDPRQPLAAAVTATLPVLFQAVAERSPQRPAVADETGTRSYGELAAASDHFARELLRTGLDRGQRVAIYGGRSIGLVTAVVGVLRAGGAFLLLDPAYPAARLAACLRQARPRVRIELDDGCEMPAELAAVADELGAHRLRLTSVRGDEAPAVALDPEDLAYVAFTSGTGGQPRGILGTHRPVAAFLAWYRDRFALTADDRFALLSGIAHDPLLRDLWTPLVLGAELRVPPPATLAEPAALVRWLRREEISVLHLTPSLAELLVRGAEPGAELPYVRWVLFGGEPLSWGQAARFSRLMPAAACVNVYGATETPQVIASYPLTGVGTRRRDEATVPVGWGREGVQLLLRNPAGGLCGVGELGEIWVRSPYLARGYLGEETLTAERFVANPWRRDPADRLYRSGDLGRYRPDGAVEFAGRGDRQVNVRGYRVEPAEIEEALAGHPAVGEVAVVGRRDPTGTTALVAWVVTADPAAGEPDAGELRAFLRGRLPEFMVPAHFATLERLPLTPNRKVDRAALARQPLVKSAERPEGKACLAPRDPFELALTQLWEELLETRPIGMGDDFFDLGGHSLLAVRLMAAIRGRFGRSLPLATLFREGTVERLAAVLRRRRGDAPVSPLVEIQRGGERQPLYCIHPVGGTVLCYAELARALGPEQPVYGLQARGLLPGETPRQRLEEMAGAYLEAVREMRPEGPYALLGWSVGGLVAYEMAQQLVAGGCRVALLALLDTWTGESPEPAMPSDVERLLTVLEGEVSVPRSALQGLDPEQQLAVVLREAKAAGALPPDFDAADVRRHMELYRSIRRAAWAYSPVPYPDRVVLFRAADEPPEAAADDTAGWRHLVAGELRIYRVPGAHRTMVNSPHVERIAERLREFLG